MKTVLVSTAVLLSLAGAQPAAAAIIQYEITGLGSGVYTDGADVTAFTDTPFVAKATIDTSTLTTEPGAGLVFQTISTYVSAFGQATPPGPGGAPLAAIGLGANAGTILLGTGPFPERIVFSSAAFVGYDGVSRLGPAPVTLTSGPGTFAANFTNGANVDFTSISNATFTAGVPEPATWAMMLMGFGALGASLRGARRRPARLLAAA